MARISHAPAGPLVIGGLGGSGTRVVAKLAIEMGFDLGNDLDQRLDDRWFNLLFFRPEWLARQVDADSPEVGIGLELMRKRAHRTLRLRPDEIRFLARAWVEVSHRTELSRHPRFWATSRLLRFLRSSLPSPITAGWGWKEPTSHLIAPDVLRHFPNARYVHVMRHGLDLVHSPNRRQLRRFGRLFGVERPGGRAATPQERLRFWIRANRRIVDGIVTTDPARTYVLRFDDLCSEPERVIGRLAEFLGVEVGPDQLRSLSSDVMPPESIGQYRSDDLADYDSADLAAVAELGFKIAGRPSEPYDRRTAAVAIQVGVSAGRTPS
jgi:hypothetical protein